MSNIEIKCSEDAQTNIIMALKRSHDCIFGYDNRPIDCHYPYPCYDCLKNNIKWEIVDEKKEK